MRLVLSFMSAVKGYSDVVLTVCPGAVTGGPDGCRDQLQKHQETRRTENWDGLHQSLSGERRLRQCCEVRLTRTD